MAFDFRLLANKLVNNNQFRLPPPDVVRMGEVTGYDPNFQNNENGNNYPTVSVALGGDTAPMHGVRFGETYVPGIGDTVMLMTAGTDAYVLHSFAGSDKDIIGTVRSASGVLAHSTIPEPTDPNTSAPPAVVNTNVLPNRLYKVEVSANINAQTIAHATNIGVTITAPDGKILNAGSLSVQANSTYNFNGFALWSDSDVTNWTTKYPQPNGANPQGTWTCGLAHTTFASAQEWSASNNYVAGDVVSVTTNGAPSYYVALRSMSQWSSAVQYVNGDLVIYNGGLWNCTPASGSPATKGTAPASPAWTEVSATPTPSSIPNVWAVETQQPVVNLGEHSIVVHDLGIADPQPFTGQ